MSVPLEMTVVEIAAPGGPEQLKPTQRPVPRPGDGEVLVRVAAAGVNRPDVMQRQGRYPAPPGASDLPGLEVAGEIAALGPKVSGLSIGDKITALLPGGGYAQYAIAAAPLCLPVPSGISMVEAAAIPETFFTVWTNLFDRGRCKAGETVLIHGGTSGIGTTAIQLAAAWGARVFATAGSNDKVQACVKLGAVRGINYRTEDFVEVMRAETAGNGVDVTLDMVAGSYVAAQPGDRGARGPRRHDFLARRRAGGNQHGHHSDQAADADRLDAAIQNCRPESRGCRGGAKEHLAAARRGPRAARHSRHVSAGRGERSASAHGDLESHRQNRADHLEKACRRPQAASLSRPRRPSGNAGAGRG